MTNWNKVIQEEVVPPPIPVDREIPAGMRTVYGWIVPEHPAEQLRPFVAAVAKKHGSRAASELMSAIVFAMQEHDEQWRGQ